MWSQNGLQDSAVFPVPKLGMQSLICSLLYDSGQNPKHLSTRGKQVRQDKLKAFQNC